MRQFEVEVVGYLDDSHEKMLYRADVVISSNDIKNVIQEVSMIYNNPNAVIVAIVSIGEARNRMCTFGKGDLE